MNKSQVIYWAARFIAAGIMAQTLIFKFTASAESVYIFSRIGMEPWGRIVVGVLELLASVLMLISRTAWLGAILAFGLMTGALFMHLTILGVVIMDDNGQLFAYSVVVASCSAYVVYKNKEILSRLARGTR
jgi:uncharacterized membrane protein YphA (DoxX/SURF4 family)